MCTGDCLPEGEIGFENSAANVEVILGNCLPNHRRCSGACILGIGKFNCNVLDTESLLARRTVIHMTIASAMTG